MPGFSHKQRKKTNGRVVKEDSESNAGGGWCREELSKG